MRKGVFDIVIYGSFIKGKEELRDIDVVIIFKENPIKERALISQEFKATFKDKIKNLDVKTINLSELFENAFFARQGILAEGYSLIYEIPLAKRMGFNNYILFTYSLKKLNHNEKTKFTYVLIGRGKNKEGILKQLDSKILGKGAVLIPIENSLMFEEFLEKWKVDYIKKNVIVSI